MEKIGLPKLNLHNYSGVIVGGSPFCFSDDPSKKTIKQKNIELALQKLVRQIVVDDVPFLGACYGLSVLSFCLGGVISKEKYAENAEAVTIKLQTDAKTDVLTRDLPGSFRAFVGHKEACQSVPPGAVLLASSDTCPVHMIRAGRNVYGTQFHPELDSEGLGLRINAYKNLGYFPAEDAQKLVHAALQETITVPQEILKRFTNKYCILE
jgi:GMP synthase (glutamine-hydrolysing)